MTTTVVPDAQWRLAGILAENRFARKRELLARMRTDARHAEEDKILDASMRDAGIIPRDEGIEPLFADLRDEWTEDEDLGCHTRPA